MRSSLIFLSILLCGILAAGGTTAILYNFLIADSTFTTTMAQTTLTPTPQVTITYTSTPISIMTTVEAVQTTLQSGNDDIKFIITIKDATHELGPIATAAGTALNFNDLSTAKTLGAKLSTRSQYWYNEVAPLSVSSKYQEPKDALCIYLSEQKAGGDSWVEMIQLLQDGKVSAANDKANEGTQHLNKAIVYINLATAELST